MVVIKAAVGALWNTGGLNWAASFELQRQKAGELDLLDWLRAMFGFQDVFMQLQMLVKWRDAPDGTVQAKE
ncbi:Callose synthase 5 [Turnera subulata]|uniref:Callose synthase 5 n=1 Tax=Turnera subulata TaxID=218843 RepID=A0A9Q0JR55_9ROSI|nr:Callose synthase 5 [Turnera subulata]